MDSGWVVDSAPARASRMGRCSSSTAWVSRKASAAGRGQTSIAEARTVAFGGRYGWVAAPNASITCCTDGVKPVVFKLELVEPSAAPELRDIPED